MRSRRPGLKGEGLGQACLFWIIWPDDSSITLLYILNSNLKFEAVCRFPESLAVFKASEVIIKWQVFRTLSMIASWHEILAHQHLLRSSRYKPESNPSAVSWATSSYGKETEFDVILKHTHPLQRQSNFRIQSPRVPSSRSPAIAERTWTSLTIDISPFMKVETSNGTIREDMQPKVVHLWMFFVSEHKAVRARKPSLKNLNRKVIEIQRISWGCVTLTWKGWSFQTTLLTNGFDISL